MQRSILLIILTASFLPFSSAKGESVARKRPAEWANLAYGGRFMDRFLPMPIQGKLTRSTWGADNVLPRYTDNGIEDNKWSYWGGNARLGSDGKYHLFVCRWSEDSPKGHMQWPHSEVVHAVSDNSFGPYKPQATIGKGHNPEIFELADGRPVIYYYGGYYISDNINGPWKQAKFKFNPRGRRIIEGLSNLSFARREDGSYLMVCRGGGIWFSQTGISPYLQVTDRSVYPPVEGRFEDPVIWRTNIQYHMIVNDWFGRIAYYLRSRDGINWKVDPGEAYLPGIAVYEDGTKVDWYKYERIKVMQDKYGRATQAHFAVIDSVKWDDKGGDNHSSKHICIPLTVGRLIEILGSEIIDAETKTIQLKVSAEKGFNPHTDIDIKSLRFGAPEMVNFGKGCKAIKTELSGKDLIITFEGKGNGITDNNFTAKLLGKTAEGKLMFGYARLPWLNYLEPALSPLMPKFSRNDDVLEASVEVQNFGQVESSPSEIRIVVFNNGQEKLVAKGLVPRLKPFEKTSIRLPCSSLFKTGTAYETAVIIEPANQKPVVFRQKITPLP